MTRYNDMLNAIQQQIMKLKSSCDLDDSPEECEKEKLEDKLELELLKQKLSQIKKSKGEDFTQVEDMEKESIEVEMMEYKKDFYDMSVGSLRAIATHAQNILNSLDKATVNENLTESWLQGKIAITEDYMRTIHDFVMYVSENDDKSTGGCGCGGNKKKKDESVQKQDSPKTPQPNTHQPKPDDQNAK